MEKELREALTEFDEDDIQEVAKLFAESLFSGDVIIGVTNAGGTWKVAKLPAWYGRVFKAGSKKPGGKVDLLAVLENGGHEEKSGKAASDRVASLIRDAERWRKNPQAVDAAHASFTEFLREFQKK